MIIFSGSWTCMYKQCMRYIVKTRLRKKTKLTFNSESSHWSYRHCDYYKTFSCYSTIFQQCVLICSYSHLYTYGQSVLIDGYLFDQVSAFQGNLFVCDEVLHNHICHTLPECIPTVGWRGRDRETSNVR